MLKFLMNAASLSIVWAGISYLTGPFDTARFISMAFTFLSAAFIVWIALKERENGE